MAMLLDNWLAQRASTCPDRLALRAADRDLTYAELERQATSWARRLASRGVRRGAVVAIALPPGVEFACALHGLMKLGAIAQPFDHRLGQDRQRADIGTSNVALVLRAGEDAGAAEADLPLLGEHDLSDLHCRLRTSGTSGAAKTVGLTYGNFLWSAVGTAFNLGIDPGDRWLCCLPLHHVAGLAILMRSVIYGTGAVLHDGFDPERVGRSLAEDRVTLVSLVATQLIRLLEEDVDISGPRAIVIGGGPVPVDVIEEAADRGGTIVQSYGMTETCSQVTALAPAEARAKAGSAGRPFLTSHLRIQAGEILVQGPTVAPGSADEDGWLHTGDLGRIDDEGFLYVEGRLGDLIVTGGENVVPGEVEAVLARHPDVAEVAVVGRPDSRWQEAVTAVVVLRRPGELDVAALREHCARELPGYKVPKVFEVAESLPRTPSGKLLRRELR